MSLKTYFVDLHIHIGATSQKSPVKITASRQLTFKNIIKECLERKGIDIIGIVDCAAPGVRKDITDMLIKGDLVELENGGWRYLNRITVLPGVEVESREINGSRGHFVSYFPGIKELDEYSKFLELTMKNINLSTQQSYLRAKKLLETTISLGGIFVPAHVFTPHKSLYGSCTNSLTDIFLEASNHIKIIELGLSADSQMADKIAELNTRVFLTNSDAHSLEKIGREYNVIELKDPSFNSVKNALLNIEGKIIANYGLNPRLGKYYHTYCDGCQQQIKGNLGHCPFCKKSKIIKGVCERILEIGGKESNPPSFRPPYIYQVPLAFLPHVGKKTINKLIQQFGSEMYALHFAALVDLEKIVGKNIAQLIISSRHGKLSLCSGGGGIYGKVRL